MDESDCLDFRHEVRLGSVLVFREALAGKPWNAPNEHDPGIGFLWMAAVQKDDEQPDLGEVGCLFEGSNWTSDGGFRL